MSDHANPAADILPRSIWEAQDGERGRVLGTAGGYVRYRLGDAAAMVAHHLTFRRAFALIYDRRAVKSQFSMSCANLAEFRAYWTPGARKLVARSVSCQREFRIPADAILVGLYAHPFNADAFLADLDCVLANLERQQAGRVAAI